MTASTVGERARRAQRRRLRVPGLDFIGHLSLGLVLLFAVLAVIGPILAPHAPNLVDLSRSYAPPSPSHPLGFDQEGRDIFSRLLFGARTSFLGPLTIVIVATVTGALLAVVAAWRGGWLDAALAGLTDLSFAFPGILLAVMAAAIFGAGLTASVIALCIAYTPYMARVIRSAALREVGKDYVDSLRVQGVSAIAICSRHVVPNIMPIVLGQAALTLAWATVDLAGLSYLGLGIQPPGADWGLMVSDGQTGVLAGHPMQSISSGLCLIVAICSFSLLGERLLRRAEAMAA
jgi:peptide/nickel transport system permease protein